VHAILRCPFEAKTIIMPLISRAVDAGQSQSFEFCDMYFLNVGPPCHRGQNYHA
jgi:hypothetical protein